MPQPATRTIESDADTVRAALGRGAAALAAGDARGVLAGYAPGATVYNLAPPLKAEEDADGLAAWIAKWDAPPRTSHRDLEVEVSGDLALAWGLLLTETAMGGELARWWARATWGLARTTSGWRIIHEHVSVPFHMDGSDRAALDLEP